MRHPLHFGAARLVASCVLALLPAAGRAETLPGGGSASSDCYAALDVAGGTVSTTPSTVTCTDGDPACDADGACGNGACDVIVRLCVNLDQVGGCTAPTELRSAVVRKGSVPSPASLSGFQCGDDVVQTITMRTRKGKPKPGRLVLRAVAKAPLDVTPRTDVDRYVVMCLPTEGACPTTSTTTVMPTSTSSSTGLASTTVAPTTLAPTSTVTTTSTSTTTSTTPPTPPTLGSFPDVEKTMGDEPFALTAPTSDSPGAFSYESSDPGVATVTGDVVTLVAPGTTTITATQAAAGGYSSASTSMTLTVRPGACSYDNPCANGGTCHNTPEGDYMCECVGIYSGPNCTFHETNCAPGTPQQCLNGGTCVASDSGGYCICDCPYIGPQCEALTECITKLTPGAVVHGTGSDAGTRLVAAVVKT